MKVLADGVSANGTHTAFVDSPKHSKTGMLFIEITDTASVAVNLLLEEGGTPFPVQSGITASTAIPIALAPVISITISGYAAGTVTVTLQD